MSMLPSSGNPIVYAQFHLQGGWRGVAWCAGLCATVLGGILVLNSLSTVGTGRPMGQVVRNWPQGLIVLQVVLLMIVSPLRVVTAIRNDVTSRMIESHRLMPMSPLTAVVGYVFGGPFSVLVLSATVFVFGSVCCALGGLDPAGWLIAHAVLAAAALFVAAVSAHLAMINRFGVVLLFVASILCIGDNGPGELLPGFVVLGATLFNKSALPLQSSTMVGNAWFCALALQLAVAAISVRAATRLYRSRDAAGLSPKLGLYLLIAWLTASFVGMRCAALFAVRFSYHGPSANARVVAAVVTALLIAAMPIAATVKARLRSTGDRAGRLTSPAGVVLFATVLISLLPVALVATRVNDGYFRLGDATESRLATAITPAVVLVALLGFANLFRMSYARWERGWPAAIAWLVVAWMIPLGADLILTTGDSDALGAISTVSPVGSLVVLWDGNRVNPFPGIAMQFAIAMVPIILAGLAHRRRTQQAVATQA